MKPLLLALLAAALVAPSASAHVESYAQSKALQAGPFLVFFEPRPVPLFAENTASLVVQISDSSTGALLTRVPVTALVGGPAEFTERKTMEGDGTGYMVASMVFPVAGNYSARILVKDERTNETHVAQTEFEVFPDIPYRIRPVDQSVDVYTGQRTPLAFEVVDPVTLAPKEVADLAIRLEHWSEDHVRFISSQDATAVKAGPGVWRIDEVFPSPGMYHVRFASDAAGFNYADVPMLHIYAISPQSAGIDEKESPGVGLLAVLALGAALALARTRRP